jgi:hypothetical protein
MVNLAGLMAMTFKAAGTGNKRMTRYIYDEFRNRPVKLIYGEAANPYNAGYMMHESFYANPNVDETAVTRPDLTDPGKMVDPGKINLLILRKCDSLDPMNSKILGKLQLRKLVQSTPAWVEWLGVFYYYPENDKILTLYRIEKN